MSDRRYTCEYMYIQMFLAIKLIPSLVLFYTLWDSHQYSLRFVLCIIIHSIHPGEGDYRASQRTLTLVIHLEPASTSDRFVDRRLRDEIQHTLVQRFGLPFPAKPSEPRILGMVDTVVQWFRGQRLHAGLVPFSFVEPTEVSRLMSAVSFGYGIYQLCVSLLSPNLLKVIHFLGFEGDRTVGLTALMYARLSEDMRAPLASLSLLWYHTIVRPFFGLDGSNLRAGVKAAKQLIAECHPEFHNSALFLFFAGRIERLESNVNGALSAYAKAVEASTQREVKLLCLHEVAWCHLIRLSYEEAYRSLTQLQQQSRWSKSFYAYIATVCCGAIGKFDVLLTTYRKVVHLATGISRETTLGLFILRRAQKLVDQDTGQPYTVLYYRLLIYELLYLWNAMPSCSAEALRGILFECKGNRTEEPMVGLSDLVEGAAYSYLGDQEAAIKSYRNCLNRRNPSNDAYDQHISAFALYELGDALCNNNNRDEGRSVLLRAQNQYRDYDFEGRLNVRIHSTLRSIH